MGSGKPEDSQAGGRVGGSLTRQGLCNHGCSTRWPISTGGKQDGEERILCSLVSYARHCLFRQKIPNTYSARSVTCTNFYLITYSGHIRANSNEDQRWLSGWVRSVLETRQ
ncbi:hypothetical protein BaRGS_00033456 [Batillaria attramentaria]|uniref:Uncharacterized protein n=1 Tax=Batillaria attramentaria TaxID=370345 RepID=A0ABD0JK03_9CAEN